MQSVLKKLSHIRQEYQGFSAFVFEGTTYDTDNAHENETKIQSKALN